MKVKVRTVKVELKSIKRSIVLIFAISLIFQIISTTKVYAYIIEDMREVPYYQYNYDVYQHEIPSAAGYYPAKTIRGEYIGSGSFKNPTDLYVDNNNTIYIMDSGNKRVIVCDKD